jgi:4-amino-4-deoxy-L-arabinose transferase-like glycosyltransferase
VNSQSPLSRRAEFSVALLLLGLVLILQAPHLARPPLDAHSFRQAQTLVTIELFARDGIDLAHARTSYVGEPGVFVLELPLFQAACALLYQWFGPHPELIRSLNLLFTFANAVLVFMIGRRWFLEETALAGAILFLLAPLNLTYMASTLLDPSGVTCSLLAFLFAQRILHPSASSRSNGVLDWIWFLVACVVTALIKALYLFPTCILLAATLIVQRRVSMRLIGSACGVALGAGMFLLWLRHGKQINDDSWFTRGVNPTVLLGIEPLFSANFHITMIKRLLLHMAGPLAAILAAWGAWSVMMGRDPNTPSARFPIAVMLVSVAGYWLAFAKVNLPHDYYSLVVLPYFCMAAGFGAGELARLASKRCRLARATWIRPLTVGALAGLLSIATFVRAKPLTPSAALVELLHACAGKLDRWNYAMVFASPSKGSSPSGSDAPGLLYATGLMGTGRIVDNELQALAVWREQRPHYQNLKYVVFYGLNPPAEIVEQCGPIIVQDDARQIFAFELK